MSLLPEACHGCTKEGMVAINCQVIGMVPQEWLNKIQCSDAHYTPEARKTAGGKYTGFVYLSTKPVELNSTPGRKKFSFPRSGAK